MALDRQSIARRDFPAARRGYDPAAVDRHLAAIADEVEELQAGPPPRARRSPAQTSEQVRAIIEAAEASAAGIREGATADAREHVARVAEAADGLRERIDALERELTGMLGALRSGAERLRADLDAISEGTSAASRLRSGPPRSGPAAGVRLGATSARRGGRRGRGPAAE